jgi:hypothetical protein
LALIAQLPSKEPTQLSALAQYLAQVLNAEVAARTALPGLADPTRVVAVAAVFDALSRAHFALRPDARAERDETDELQRGIADLALRLLR